MNDIGQIIENIMFLYHVTRQPVPTKLLADTVGYSDRQMRRKLNLLEETGILKRVGKRKGWEPSRELIQFRRIQMQPKTAAMAA